MSKLGVSEEEEFESEVEDEEDEDMYEVLMEESLYSDIVVSTLRLEKGKMRLGMWLQSLTVLLVFMIVEVGLVFFLVPLIAPGLHKSGIYGKAFYKASNTSPETVNLYFDYAEGGDGMEKHVPKGMEAFAQPETEAQWACKGDIWSWVETQLSDMKEYASPVGPFSLGGRVFGTLALGLWSLLIMKEFRAIMEFLCLLMLEDESGLEGYSYSKGSYELHSLTCKTRVVLLLVAVYRTVLNVFIGYYGARFLASTETCKDFILNSIALGFIYDLDEMFFSVLLPSKQISAVRNVEPIVLNDTKVPKCFMFVLTHMGFIAIIVTIIFVVLLQKFYLAPFIDLYLCHALQMVCPDHQGLETFCAEKWFSDAYED